MTTKNKLEGDKTQYQIYSTYNYDQFKLLPGNRDINKAHVYRLKKSIEENGMLVNPIIVTPEGYIIDGQHTWSAAKLCEDIIYYIILEHYGINEVQVLNMNQRGWGNTEFLNMHCEMHSNKNDRSDYIKLREFQEEFGFPLSVCIQICSNVVHGTTGASRNMAFRDGTWKMTDKSKAFRLGRQLQQLKQYFPKGYCRSVFVGSIISAQKIEGFSMSELLKKVKIAGNHLETHGKIRETRLNLDKVYNYRRRADEKIDLRMR